MSNKDLIARLRYMARQRGGNPTRKHYFDEAADALEASEPATCTDERPCLPCYLANGPCEAPHPSPVNQMLVEALEVARYYLVWYSKELPGYVTEADHEALAQIDAALAAAKGEA